MNMVQTVCTLYVNAKILPVYTVPGIRGEKYKGEQWRG
jgi:hypothetical protein